MKTFNIAFACLLAAIALRHPSASAQTASAPSAAAVSRLQRQVDQITHDLQDDDLAVKGQAFKKALALYQSSSFPTYLLRYTGWTQALLDMQRTGDVLQLTQAAILSHPWDNSTLEQMQSHRVQALLQQGKPAEALIAAKQLFNIATIGGTADAIRTVSQCLSALHPDDHDLLRRYKQEQTDGARPDQPPPSPSSLILAAVRIDPSPYVAAIAQITGEDRASLDSLGNLLLLSGDTTRAWQVFERAYSMAADKDLPAATEDLARCMRAQDGTIGRTNAWILSLRPREELASERPFLPEPRN
jgi:tetratricopeptide (TPR) repeat protein